MNDFLAVARRPRALGALLALALIAAGCSAGRGDAKPMQIKVLRGSVQLLRGDFKETIRSDAGVRAGDRLVQSKDGIAELRLASGRLFEIAAADVRVPSQTEVTINRGDLLATITAPAKVGGEGIEVTSKKGVFRIDRSLSTRVGVYTGAVRLRSNAQSLDISRLRQAIVAGSVVPRAPKPLRIESSDAWDRRFLQEALDLDVRLTNFGRGLEAQLGDGGGPAFFARIMPGSELGFLGPHLGSRRSDLLIGLAVSAEAAKSESSSLADVFNRAFGLWIEGATWGLIAYEFGVGQPSIFSILLDAVRRAGIRIGGGPAVARSSPTPRPTPAPGPAPSPKPTPPPSPTPGPTDPIEDILDELIKQLPTPPPPPVP